jgi:hypothetical protein
MTKMTLNHPKEPSWTIFSDLVDQGVDPDEIIQAARAYAIEVSSAGVQPLPMADWLQAKPWQQRRN